MNARNLLFSLAFTLLFVFTLAAYSYAKDGEDDDSFSSASSLSSSRSSFSSKSSEDRRARDEEKRLIQKRADEIMRAKAQEKKEQLKALKESTHSGKKQEIIAKKCEELGKKIDERIAKYQENHANHVGKYEALVNKLANLVSELEKAGKNVTTLKNDLAVLEAKIKKMNTDHAAFIEKLKATKDYTCGASEGKYAQALKAAREAQKKVIEDAKDIRKYFETEVRKHIRELKGNASLHAPTTPKRSSSSSIKSSSSLSVPSTLPIEGPVVQ